MLQYQYNALLNNIKIQSTLLISCTMRGKIATIMIRLSENCYVRVPSSQRPKCYSAVAALRPSVELVHRSDFYKCYWWRMFSEAMRDACGALITQTGDVLQRRSGRSFPMIYLQCANGPVTLQWRRLLTFTARNGAHSELKWRENKKRFILRAAAATLLDWDQ